MTAPDMTSLVAPLAWVETNPGVFVAETNLGVWARFDGHYMTPEGYGGISAADPEAAAQADYAARIIAALDPAALAAMLAEAREQGRREAATAIADMHRTPDPGPWQAYGGSNTNGTFSTAALIDKEPQA